MLFCFLINNLNFCQKEVKNQKTDLSAFLKPFINNAFENCHDNLENVFVSTFGKVLKKWKIIWRDQ
jgi:hypothetical protein